MNDTTQAHPEEQLQSSRSAWWRNPYCWLVISGPLVVVLAGVATMLIAYGGADSMASAYVEDRAAARQQAAAVSMLPAQLARNRAALGPPAAD